MNHLPQYELLSAYLDGELTAAEQAEVERLLATNPAARRLFDELHALSATLQALPQQKLGEDLSQKVLRIAERRMLTEGEPGEELSSDAPVPLKRSIAQRFFNRRAVFWLGLTAAIAVMITIHDRQQQGNPAMKANREVAQATAKRADKFEGEELRRKGGEPIPPPSIQAAHDAPAETKAAPDVRYVGGHGADRTVAKSPAATPSEKSPEKSASSAASEEVQDYNLHDNFARKSSDKKTAEGYFDKAGVESGNDIQSPGAMPAAPTPSKAMPPNATPQSLPPGGMGPGAGLGMGRGDGRHQKGYSPDNHASKAGKGGIGGMGGMGNNTLPPDNAYGMKAGTGTDGGRWADAAKGKGDENPFGEQAGRLFAAPPNVNKKAGEKAADRAGRDLVVVYCDITPDAAKNKSFFKLLDANGIKQFRKLNQKTRLSKSDDDGKASVPETVEVSVNATPAQIDATLAGLAAQPDLFLTVSVEPPRGQTWEMQHPQSASVAGEPSNLNDYSGQVQSVPKANVPAPAYVPKQAEGTVQAKRGTPKDAEVDKAKQNIAQASPPANEPKPPERGKGMGKAAGKTAGNTEGIAKGIARPAEKPTSEKAPSKGSNILEPKKQVEEEKETPTEPAEQTLVPEGDEKAEPERFAAQYRSGYALQPQQPLQTAVKQRVLFVLRVAEGPPVAASKADVRNQTDAAKNAVAPSAPPTQPAAEAPPAKE
jgi:hypothetical protein